MHNLFFMCNALDDITRLERGIVTDSPAASRKVFNISKATRKAGVRVLVISLGRGKQDGSGRYFRSKVCRLDGVPVIYLPFFHLPVLSELLTLFSSVPLLWRLHKKINTKTVLFYNRIPAYLFVLVFTKILRIETALDLEDGETDLTHWSLSGIKSRILSGLYDTLCSGGALLACQALESATKLRPTLCCYGTSEAPSTMPNWGLLPITVLLGGTVSYDTGAQLLIDAIRILRKKSPSWAKNIRFTITGKGDCIEQFKALADDTGSPEVIVYGRTTDEEYRQILTDTHIGLSLKPISGVQADTTFPSKVIEFASQGILVVTTDISDVREVLAEGAIYLEMNDSTLLIEKLRWIVENRDAARALSLNGVQAVSAICAPERVGQMLSEFLFESSTGAQH
ncbi:MAG: glycosyltransferase [Methylobacter sp.]|uniref:glycosyltransferase n=1 Tax=Methylobacter sp. TaxID=2051955 RepID=UPI002731764B|nr:glycosyltransferase [Methylobacter sp.]MDP1666446.1 glycosyltransferase [Methylobacter sp.]